MSVRRPWLVALLAALALAPIARQRGAGDGTGS